MFRARQGERQFIIDVLEAMLFRQKPPGAILCTIFMVGRQNFIAGPEVQTTGDDVTTGCGIADENEIVPICTRMISQPRACFLQQGRCTPIREFHRLVFKFSLPTLARFKYRSWRGTE